MKVSMYVRVSTSWQALTQTIEQQIQLLSEHSQAQGWPWHEEYLFRDDGYSGASLRRPGLDRLRDQIRNGAFDRIVVTAPDRLARNYVHQMLLVEEFEQGGCQVEFVDRPMSQDPHDQLLLQIRGAVAEYERSLIAERMRRGRRQKYQAGCLLPWTRPPYGYRVDPAQPREVAGVRVDPAEAAVVADLFVHYLEEGQTLQGVTKRLMTLEIPTPGGHWRWNQATVRGILTNPVYTGTVYLGRSRPVQAQRRHSAFIPIGRGRGGHRQTSQEEWIAVAQVPALVSQEQFEQVQAKLAHNQQCARRNNTAHPYLLRALVSCGQCHLACNGRCSPGGYAYYVCLGRSQPVVSHRDETCSARYIPAEQLDEVVWQDVCEVLTHSEFIASALQQAQAGQWLPQALQAIAGQVRHLETDVQHHDELAVMAQSIEAFCQRVAHGLAEATFEQKRQLIELLVDRVVVTGEEVEIRYVIPTSPNSEQIRFCHLRLDYFDDPMLSDEHYQTQRCSLGQRKTAYCVDHLQAFSLLGAPD
jgi:site-specific DNA recombinase